MSMSTIGNVLLDCSDIASGKGAENIQHDLHTLNLMARMAMLKARPPIIAAVFGISVDRARYLYRSATKEVPKKGRMPEVMDWFVESADRHLHGVWLATSFAKLFRHAKTSLQKTEALLIAYEQYCEEFEDQKISFDRFYFLTRWIFYSQEIKLKECVTCNSTRLEVKHYSSIVHVTCPICSMAKL